MSIESHKWFDATGVSQLGRERGELWIEFDSKVDPVLLGINKQDAKAIAKHFNVDNERVKAMSIEDEKEFDRVLNDILFLGQGFVKDGKRVPPEDVYLDRYDILVEGIKELIRDKGVWSGDIGEAVVLVDDLQKLIIKEE